MTYLKVFQSIICYIEHIKKKNNINFELIFKLYVRRYLNILANKIKPSFSSCAKILEVRDGQAVDFLAFRREILASNSELVKLTQVAIDSPPMQPCTVCRGGSRSDGPRQLATSLISW